MKMTTEQWNGLVALMRAIAVAAAKGGDFGPDSMAAKRQAGACETEVRKLFVDDDPPTLLAFENPDHVGNSSQFYSGRPCRAKGCGNPAGTMWSPLWCFTHNVERMNRITAGLTDATRRTEVAAVIDQSVGEIRDWAHKNACVARAMVVAAGGSFTFHKSDLTREMTTSKITETPYSETWEVTLAPCPRCNDAGWFYAQEHGGRPSMHQFCKCPVGQRKSQAPA